MLTLKLTAFVLSKHHWKNDIVILQNPVLLLHFFVSIGLWWKATYGQFIKLQNKSETPDFIID